jgi:glutathione synthase/RimK-type ligase-like ATP-grasp enzyme
MKLRVATCKALPEPDADAEPLAAALREAGVDFELLAWDDPAVDWDAPAPTILRSTWNYAHHLDAFLAWIDRVEAASPLLNPGEVVHGNVRKRYLLQLAARGVPVIATTLVEKGRVIPLPEEKLVIKPEVGAGSLGTRVFEAGDPAAADHLAALTRTGAALVQPYVASVNDYGERSLVWIDGALSHAIRKSPRFSGDREAITGPFPIADDERAVAEAALAPYADQILYGRCDLARDEHGQPRVMELELVEPSLFFARQPGAAARYVAGLLRRLE